MGRFSNSAATATAVRSIAARQHGVVTRQQLRQAGLSDDRIDGWARTGRIQRVFRGVYAVGPGGLPEQARILAAVLACGPGSVASHRSAAFLLRIGERSPRVVDVITPGQGGRQIDGIRVHDVPRPGAGEVVRVHGIPCTNAARMVVDLAGTYGEAQFREVVERAATEGVLDLEAIDAILARGPRRGAPCLRRVLKDWRPVRESTKYPTFRSLFEAKLLPLLVAAGLPMPRFNAPVRTHERILEVDLLWPDARFILEADSRRHHALTVAFERDRKRDRELLAAHYTVLRVTWKQVEKEPRAICDAIRSKLRPRRTADLPHLTGD